MLRLLSITLWRGAAERAYNITIKYRRRRIKRESHKNNHRDSTNNNNNDEKSRTVCASYYWWFAAAVAYPELEIEIITIDILFLRFFFSFLFYREEAQHLEEIDCLCFWLFGVPLLLVSIPFSSTAQLNTNQKDFFFCLVKNKRNIRKKLFSFFYITAAGQNEVRKNLPLDRNRDLLTTFAAIPSSSSTTGGKN
jgi:hypothetical protein